MRRAQGFSDRCSPSAAGLPNQLMTSHKRAIVVSGAPNRDSRPCLPPFAIDSLGCSKMHRASMPLRAQYM